MVKQRHDDCVYEWDGDDDKDEDEQSGAVLVVWTTQKTTDTTKITVLEQTLWSNKMPASIKLDLTDTIVHAWCGPGRGKIAETALVVAVSLALWRLYTHSSSKHQHGTGKMPCTKLPFASIGVNAATNRSVTSCVAVGLTATRNWCADAHT